MTAARRLVARGLVMLTVVGALVVLPAIASAHPLGNFTINVYAGLEIGRDRIDVDYVVDMAEIPTFQALPAIDADGDGSASATELAAWARRQAPRLATQLDLSIDGRPWPLAVLRSTAELRPGQGGLHTMRIEIGLRADAPGGAGTLTFENRTLADRIGWREVSASASDGETIARSDVPATSVSDRLLAYPQDRLRSPLHVTSAVIRFTPGTSSTAGTHATIASAGDRPQIGDGRFAALVGRRGASLVVLAVLLALGFGALHAIGPGHGKTLMAAYLVGTDGRIRQAVGVGVAVAAMHSASVLALGALVVSAERLFPVERVYGWLGLASGVVALGLGVGLLTSRIRAARRGRPPASGDGAHDHEHGHPHPHAHAGPGVGAARGAGGAGPASRRGLVALALAGGILPSPSALVVLLASISVGRTAFGLALIAAFSVGLAATLVGVGALALRARSLIERRGSRAAARLLPIGSAAGIAALGAVLTARALVQL